MINQPVLNFGHVGLLLGGPSSEREISLKSGEAVYQALLSRGVRVSKLDILSDDEQNISRQLQQAGIDVAFIALHGHLGEDGRIQSILEKLNIPYTGSGVEASRKALNKTVTQTLLKVHGVPVAEHLVLKKDQKVFSEEVFKRFGNKPVVVKPACEGSSIGVVIVRRLEDIPHALEKAFTYGPDVLVETFIEGREMTVGILGDEPLDVIEIKAKSAFFDFTAKYQSASTEYVVPAEVSVQIAVRLKAIALEAYRVLGCRHLGRVDFILDSEEKPFVLEINTIPGFTKTSLLPKAAAAGGIDFVQLCFKLLDMAYGR